MVNAERAFVDDDPNCPDVSLTIASRASLDSFFFLNQKIAETNIFVTREVVSTCTSSRRKDEEKNIYTYSAYLVDVNPDDLCLARNSLHPDF